METQNQPRVFPVVAELVEQAEEAAAGTTDTLAQLAHAIEAAIHGDADPYVLLGVLVEGIAQTLGGIPPERSAGATLATASMLRERIREHEPQRNR